MGSYIVSASGVTVWNMPEEHPLLKHTDTKHPYFLNKATEVFPRGTPKGLPIICSENSEDACTWHYFSPLLSDESRRTEVLTRLLRDAFADGVPSSVFEAVISAELRFWPKLTPPPSRPNKEGPSESDVLFEIGRQALVLVEAKYKSPVSKSTKYDSARDQVIRLLDVGSYYAEQTQVDSCFVIVLQYGNHSINAEEIVSRYRGRPESIQRAIAHYRTDLTASDYPQMSRSVAFIQWADPMDGV